jgi:hypothetical protein
MIKLVLSRHPQSCLTDLTLPDVQEWFPKRETLSAFKFDEEEILPWHFDQRSLRGETQRIEDCEFSLELHLVSFLLHSVFKHCEGLKA